ncbi:MAG: hypothetical protein HQK67_10520 [Desulfamplus sp.]|nr:hypothetical protein [Desulfamplus sp.]
MLGNQIINIASASVPKPAANWVGVESSESAKVAQWLRDVEPADNDSSHFSVIGLQKFSGLGNIADNVISTQGISAFYQNSQAVLDAQNI